MQCVSRTGGARDLMSTVVYRNRSIIAAYDPWGVSREINGRALWSVERVMN